MKTLNISISELEYINFGFKRDTLSFSEFVDIVTSQITKQTLKECVELAEKFGLSAMTMEEISAELKAVRNAKAGN